MNRVLGPANSAANNVNEGCLEIQIITAMKKSTTPFTSFLFDGILRLGRSSLAFSEEFSFSHMMTSRLPAPQFDVSLSEHEQSEIFIGGYISHKTMESLDWASVLMSTWVTGR